MSDSADFRSVSVLLCGRKFGSSPASDPLIPRRTEEAENNMTDTNCHEIICEITDAYIRHTDGVPDHLF